MKFDNAEFERRLHTTLSSLSQLDKALKLTGAHKGLADVGAAAKKIDLSPVGQAADSLGSRFSAMATIAVTALATITHAAITSGGAIVKSLSLDPVLDGFREYEQNIGSIQTILANTRADGTGLQEVNDALNTLNEYSDKTIYNFGQMTRNIGTFTAAGVDLDTSVQSIKGISNLAAISGSTAEQAATAMYQLSQAVSTGTLRLMDWNSVVNAGMGGEVFQKALFETGVAMQTITDAPVGTTFEEWTAKGNSFRDSLQDGWLTSEVLTNTLAGFTGELTEAQLLAIGYTKEQAAEIIELGKSGVEAATKIRTLSQLMNTVKETIGSGWSASFRTVLGDFEQASELFTDVNNAISGFINRNADARNELLAGWAAFGGREDLIEGIKDAFGAFGDILKPIHEAFRDIFPPVTIQRLVEMTHAFADFTASLRPSETTIENIKRIFTGLFSALDIGWEVIKAGVGFIKDLVLEITGLGNGNILEFAADIADFFTRMRDGLDDGEAIPRFFERLTEAVKGPIQYIHDLKDAVGEFFDGIDKSDFDGVSDAAGRFESRFSGIRRLFDGIVSLSEPVKDFFEGFMDILDSVTEALGQWLSELGDKLRDAMGPGDFDAVLDALNVSLLGGIALLISKFLSGGINLDFGGGLLGGIKDSFEELTGVLEAMQTSIRADALLKIAGAVGILTASVVALSLIDSAALTKALTAMAVGFAQLMGSFAIINQMDAGIVDGSAFTIIATGMILLSTAIVILSGAVAILGNMGWDTLVKGLAGVTALLAVLTASAIILSKNSGSILLASVSLIAMSTALSILAGVVAIFATMEWDTMVKGFAGVAAGLLILAGAMRLMPEDLVLRGAGLILIATALNILAGAVALFATMQLDTLAKGFAGVAAGLLIIAAAMRLMPSGPKMVLASVGLVAVGVALNLIAAALKIFGSMSFEEMSKGLIAMGGALLILVLAVNTMSGALAGAAAMVIVAGALAIIARSLAELGNIPAGEIVKALAAVAAALLIFGVAAHILMATGATASLLALGVAMLALGAAFALFGVGALAVAKAFQLLGEAGPEAADALLAAMEALGKALPAVLGGFAEGIVEVIRIIGEAAPVIAEALGVLLGHILDTLIELTPKVGELVLALIETILEILTEAIPDIVAAGIELIIGFLTGIRDNIYQVTDLVLDIITEFLNAIADNIATVSAAGTEILVNLILGMTNHIVKITEAVGTLITSFIDAVAGLAVSIAAAGTQALVDFLTGMTDNAVKIANTVTSLITTFITATANNATRIVTAGANSLIKFVQGIGNNVNKVVKAGVQVIISFIQGIADSAIKLARAASDILINFLNALAEVIREKSPELRQAGLNIALAIIDGITGGLASKAKGLAESFASLAEGALGSALDIFGIHSPSKVFFEMGEDIVAGLALGIGQDKPVTQSVVELTKATTKAFQQSIDKAMSEIGSIPEFNPVITPVLDLTGVRSGARLLSGLMDDTTSFSPSLSFGRANTIASTREPIEEGSSGGSSSPSVVKFEQNNYSPEALSTSAIYKSTRNQISLAKDELGVP
jgi:tape measure domain-containing protein